jgi:hypothetical protein
MPTDHEYLVMHALARALLEALLRRGFTKPAARRRLASALEIWQRMLAAPMPDDDALANLLVAHLADVPAAGELNGPEPLWTLMTRRFEPGSTAT